MTTPQVLANRYEIGELLGSGGMSEVFRARDSALGRHVAVKVMRADLVSDDNFYQRFRREAHNSASLGHPSIVAIYDTGEEVTGGESLPYIVMELVDGDTLRDLVRMNGAMDTSYALGVMADVCGALDFSHRKGIIHRDVKPANIMINREGAVKVMDFGIARAVSESTSTLTQTSAVLGTAQYLSPEQARGESVDNRSDVYSAGCVLYEMVTGQPPFVGESPIAVAYQHVREDPVLPSLVNPDLDRYVDAIVLQAMSKNPENRYATAGDMRTDLLAVLSGQRPSAPLILSNDDLDEDHRPTADHGFRGSGFDTGRTAWGAGPMGLAAGSGGEQGSQFSAGEDPDAPTEVHQLPVASSDAGPHRGSTSRAGSQAPARQSEAPAPSGRRSRKNRPSPAVIAASALLVLALAAGAAFIASRQGNDDTEITQTQEVTIPELARRPASEVIPELEALGLVVLQEEQTDPDIPQGEVVSSDPIAGKRLPVGGEIRLVVSAGKPILSVPNVLGMDPAEAQKALTDAGFMVVPEPQFEPSTESDEGKVVSTDPGPASQVPSDQEITLTVGSGPEEVAVPEVVGQHIDEARLALEEAGLRVDVVQVDGVEPQGQVIAQSSQAGSEQIKGATITVEVSAGNRFLMPDLVNLRVPEALSMLSTAGWKGDRSQLVELPQNVPDLSRVGKIYSQQPPPGEAGINDQIVVRVIRFGLIAGPG